MGTTEQEGPSAQVELSCLGCKHAIATVIGTEHMVVRCEPLSGGRVSIVRSDWTMPPQCPHAKAKAAMVKALAQPHVASAAIDLAARLAIGSFVPIESRPDVGNGFVVYCRDSNCGAYALVPVGNKMMDAYRVLPHAEKCAYRLARVVFDAVSGGNE